MEAPSSPSTCLSLSSDFFSPTNSVSSSHVGSWPNSCSSSPKRGFINSSPASCPSSPKRLHRHFNQHQAAAAAAMIASSSSSSSSCSSSFVDCTLSLGNASTRKSPSPSPSPSPFSAAGTAAAATEIHEVPSRLSRAGSPICDSKKNLIIRETDLKAASEYYFQQQEQSSQWPKRQTINDLLLHQDHRHNRSFPAANRGLDLNFYRQQQSPMNSQIPTFAQDCHGMINANKFGFMDFGAQSSGGFGFGVGSDFGHGGSNNISSNSKNSLNSEPCSTRSRFRGLDSHNDPRNVPRICAHCGTSSTPLWRNGPLGPKSLCNACGIRFKKVGRRSPVAAPATASTSAWGLQSNPAGNNLSLSSEQTLGFPVKFNDQEIPRGQHHYLSQQIAEAVQVISNSGSQDLQRQQELVDQVQRCRNVDNIPFAKEWNPAAECSPSVGSSSCITWQDNMPSIQPYHGQQHNHRGGHLVVNKNKDHQETTTTITTLPAPSTTASGTPPLVLDAEVIRSVHTVHAGQPGESKDEEGRFLRMSL